MGSTAASRRFEFGEAAIDGLAGLMYNLRGCIVGYIVNCIAVTETGNLPLNHLTLFMKRNST